MKHNLEDRWGYVVETRYDDGRGLGARGYWTYILTAKGTQVTPGVYSSLKRQGVADHGEAIIKATERSRKLSELLQSIISIGYEQQRCNTEGLVDYEDAMCIHCEGGINGNEDRVEANSFVDKLLREEEKLLEDAFNNEFKVVKGSKRKRERETRIRIVDHVRRAQPGTPTFWEDLLDDFNLIGRRII